MSFTYPSFLFALAAVCIPIIIHLFNFRKFKTVYFSNVQFLKEVKQETQAKSKLKHLLVLASRILAITFLVFAFAQPFIPKNDIQSLATEKIVSIFIDNSFSMETINKNGSLLDDAKRKALDIVSSFKATDQFQILTNDFEGRHQRLVNKGEFEELLNEVQTSSVVKNINEITSRQIDILQTENKTGEKSLLSFIISDFQKSNFNFEDFKNDTTITFNLIHLESAKSNNIFIDSCWFESPVRQVNKSEKLHVRIKNLSDLDLENNSIKLFINDVQKTPSSFSVSNHSEIEIVIPFLSNKTEESSILNCRLEIKDHPISFDDNFFFSYEIAKNIPVLCINAHRQDTSTTESLYLNKLFQQDSVFSFRNTNEKKIDYSSLSNNSLIILNGLKEISTGLALELKRFMTNGGALLLLPHPESNIASYKQFLLGVNANYLKRLDTIQTKVDKINLSHYIYKDVFDRKSLKKSNLNLPIVNRHYSLSKSTKSNGEHLLQLQNGDALLSQYDIGQGKLYLSSISLESNFSNFAKHSIFVPTLYNIGLYSQNPQPLFYVIGNNKSIESRNVLKSENVYHIKDHQNTGFDIIPEHTVVNSKTRINTHNQIIKAGNYKLYSGPELITGLSFNFNRKESHLACPSKEELKDQVTNYNTNNIKALSSNPEEGSGTISGLEKNEGLWKYCLILALLFLGSEVLLLRFMKG